MAGKGKVFRIFLWVLAVFVVLNLIAFTAIPYIATSRITDKHVEFSEAWTPEESEIQANHFFVTTDDGVKISAYEVRPEGRPRGVVICIPGIDNPSTTAFFGHARMFRENGYATIPFDLRAHGDSGGDMICLGYKEYLDTKAVVDWIKGNEYYSNVPVVVLGLSMGAATAIISMGKIPEIDAMITLSAYSSWEDVFYEQMRLRAPGFLATLCKPFIPAAMSLKYGVNAWKLSPEKLARKLGDRNALVMHSTEDSIVPYECFREIVYNLPCHIETLVRQGNMHSMVMKGMFRNPEQDTEYRDVVMGFLDRKVAGDTNGL